MQNPTQTTSPVDPQLGVHPVSDQPGQLTGQSVVVPPVLATDNPLSPIQAAVDPTQTVADPTQAVDPQTTTPQPPQPGESAPHQNPLDVLESILAEAKQKVGQKAPTDQGGGGDSVAGQSGNTTDHTTPPPPPPPTPEEIATKEAAHQAEIEQQKQQLMAQISQTPEYQAKVQQDAEKAEEESQSSAVGDGFQIQQLQHTKI